MTDIQARADRCNTLLNDPDLKEAFQNVENAITETWKSSSQGDKAGHKYLKLSLHVLSSVRASLEQAVSDGKLEAYNIDQAETVVPILGDVWNQKKKALKKG